MSDPTEIKAALTASEWDALRLGDTRGCDGPYDVAIDGASISYDPGMGMYHTIDQPVRHALAALCLYKQPFGFTHTDVDDVRSGILALREQQCDLIAAGLESLASRIAALLPPPNAQPEEGAA